MAWSIFSDGGGPGAAATWADDALRELGDPVTGGNEQFIYDWEVSEGGGGKYNPLNQGPDPADPSLTSTGPQYGGGAADYISYSAGLKGLKDYLAMPNFASIQSSLKANDPVGARSALINSPWAASHYGGGASFSDAPLPGKKNRLQGTQGTLDTIKTTGIISGLSGFGTVLSDVGSADFWERVGLVIGGFILIIVGIIILALPAASRGISAAGSASRSLNAAGNLIGGDSGGPTEEEKADRSRRLDLAERNVAVGEAKVQNVRMREERLSLGKPKKRTQGLHPSEREPNPNPAHS